MPSNVEIKARVADLAELRARAFELGARPDRLLEQRDTFYTVPRGRLKLRELSESSGELIFYERPDQPGPKRSDYSWHPTSDPRGLRALLGDALPVRGVVEKEREVLILGQTRIHLDEVVGLGRFLELEVVLAPGQSTEDGERVARELLTAFGIAEFSLESAAYVDLLEGAVPGASERAASRFDAREASWLLFVYLLVQGVVAIAATVLLGVIYVIRGGDPSDTDAITRLSSNMVAPIGLAGALGGGLALFGIVLRRCRRPGGETLRRRIGLSRGSSSALLLGLGVGIAIAGSYLALAVSLPLPAGDLEPGPMGRMAITPGWQNRLWMFVALALAPPIEEFVFRGALFAGFARSWGRGAAAILTTALFVGAHLSEVLMLPRAVIPLTALSLAALALRLRSGALGPAIAAHFGYNLCVVFAVVSALAL